MTIQLLEGFEANQNFTDFGRKFTIGTMTQPTFDASFIEGRLGFGSAFEITTTGLVLTSYVFPTIDQQWYVGLALKFDRPQDNLALITLVNSTSGDQLDLVLVQETDTAGVPTGNAIPQVRRGPVILGQSSVTISAGEWHFLEFGAYIDPTVGSYEVRLGGVNILSAVNVNTSEKGAGGADQVRFNFATDAQPGDFFHIDDIYTLDGKSAGAFLGDVQIEMALPTSDGAYTDFTLASGPLHYAMVDDAADPDDDVTYIQSDVFADRDSFKFGPLQRLQGGVKTVLHESMLRLDQVSIPGRGVRLFSRIATTNYPGTAFFVTDATYKPYIQSWEVNPRTLAPWAVGDIKNTEFGFEITS